MPSPSSSADSPEVLPEVVLKLATSFDGALDDRTPARAIFSGPEDTHEVDLLRAGCDAILVGAETVRKDDPRLRLKSEEARIARNAAGRTGEPLRVCLTRTGRLPVHAAIFQPGGGEAFIYAPQSAGRDLQTIFNGRVTVVGLPATALSVRAVLLDLAARGVRRLLVEGGAAVAAACLNEDLVDHIRIAVSPRIIGDPAAPRLPQLGTGRRKIRIVGTRPAGSVFVIEGIFCR